MICRDLASGFALQPKLCPAAFGLVLPEIGGLGPAGQRVATSETANSWLMYGMTRQIAWYSNGLQKRDGSPKSMPVPPGRLHNEAVHRTRTHGCDGDLNNSPRLYLTMYLQAHLHE